MGVPGLIHHFAHTMLRSAEAHGYDRTEILGPSASRDGPAGNQPFGPEELAQISRRVKLVMGDEFCGFTQAGCRLGSFRLMCELCVLSETLEDALRRAFRFYDVLTEELKFSIAVRKDTCIIEVDGCQRDGQRFLGEWWTLLWHRLSQWLIGEEIPIITAEFAHAPIGSPLEYMEVFGSNIAFGAQSTRIVFPAKFLQRNIVKGASELEQFLSPQSVDLVSTPGVHKSVRSLVKAKLRSHLERSQSLPTLEMVAAEYGMCGQTLRRRLEAEGTSYRELKTEVRREVVLKCLGDAEIPISRVSLIAGFAEPNGLARAVRLWAGVSPREYRERVLQNSH